MEVSGRNHHVFVGEDIGVVGGGVDLVLKDGFHVHDIVLDGAVHLRDAAETVGVLNMGLGAAYELTAFQKLHEALSRCNLALVRAKMVREGKEWLNPAVVGIQGNGAYYIGPGRQPHALEDAPHGMGAHELRAVKKSQAFLGLKPYGLPAHFLPYFGRRTDLPFVQHFSKAD